MPIQRGQKQARGLARRQQILEEALHAFSADGYRATTLAKVAGRVGLTEAGVIHHFPSKADLFAEVLRWRDNREPNAIGRVRTDDILESVRRMAGMVDIILEHPELMRFDAVVGGESIAEGGLPFEHFRERLRHARHAISQNLGEAMAVGSLRDDLDPDVIAAEAIAFMDGIQTQWLFDPERIDLRAAYRQYFDALATRLAPLPTRGETSPAT